jgi:putative protease
MAAARPIELLSPARDLECGMAAILCGADAVYIGAPRFGARSAAGNSLDDIARLIAFAHKYYAKVYVTVNTVLYDEEIEAAKTLFAKLHELSADGAIIQDVGLLTLDLPPIPLIASTQMHNHTCEKISFLEKLGFRRVILARELSLVAIRDIAAGSDIELECFIHGALCVCYSGQCYLSYAIGGRSANRGECAQPCRKKYSLVTGDGQVLARELYLLSLKDLCLAGHLRELIEAGVTSFKIEGRLKDVSYVKNVVSFYRQELDRVLRELGRKRSSSGKSSAAFIPNLYKTFNRGYTSYFLHGRTSDIASPLTPGMTGELVGKVVAATSDHFVLDGCVELHAGDGIAFFDAQNRRQGTNINAVEGRKIVPATPQAITPGTVVYRNSDHHFLQKLLAAKVERTMALSLELCQAGAEYVLRATDEDGVSANVRLKVEGEAARNAAGLEALWHKQLAKWGGSEFRAESIAVKLATPPFVSVHDMNELRRRLTHELLLARAQARPRATRTLARTTESVSQSVLDFSANVCNRYAHSFYQEYGAHVAERGAETGLDMRGRKVMTTKLCLCYQLGLCPRHHGKEVAGEPWYLLDEMGRKYRLRFDCVACVMEIYG